MLVGHKPKPQRNQHVAANIELLQGEIQSYQNQITSIQNEIALLQVDRNNYSDPVFVANELANLEADYNADMNAYDVDEANQIALVPDNKALAGKLGIGAAVGLASGTYMTVDGSKDC